MFQDNQDKMTRPTGTCNYKVIIETSCRSPPHTTDRISISFGDAHGSEVLFCCFEFNLYTLTVNICTHVFN